MKTYTVCVPTDYLMGHLRYGHVEFDIEAESAEEAIQKLQKNKEICQKMDEGVIPNDPDFEEIDFDRIEVDDYRIDDFGDIRYEKAYVSEEG